MNFINDTIRMFFAAGALVLVALLSTPNIDENLVRSTPRSISNSPLNAPIKDLELKKLVSGNPALTKKKTMKKSIKRVTETEIQKSNKKISLSKS